MSTRRDDSIDLERAVIDPEYRRRVIADLNAQTSRRDGKRRAAPAAPGAAPDGDAG